MFPKPVDDAYRLDVLQSYGVLDTPPEPAFDRVTRLAARLLDAPIALVSLIDRERQWFKSYVGLDLRETPREMAFCGHAILSDAVMVVPDARADSRFELNPLVVGPPYIRFYAGAPLVTTEGFRLGTLCVIDTRPRGVLTADQQTMLHDFAAAVVDGLEYRRVCGANRDTETDRWLRAAKEAAERMNTAKSKLLAMMSHELRTPLYAVLGFSEVLKLAPLGPLGHPNCGDYVRIIHQAADHLMTMIGTILDFASAEKGEVTIEEVEVDLIEIAGHCIGLLSEVARRAGVAVSAKFSTALPAVKADRPHLLQTLLDLGRLLHELYEHALRRAL